jgi:hypothetical protein
VERVIVEHAVIGIHADGMAVLVWMHWMGLKLDTFAFGGILKAAQ